MMMHVDLRATALAPATARRIVERFIQSCPQPIGSNVQAFAIWLTSELVTAAVAYSSTPSTQFGLRLSCDEQSYTATVTGKDGVSLLVREIADETPRSRAVELLTQIADRWGSRSGQDSDHVWIAMDLGEEDTRHEPRSEKGRRA